MPRLGELVETSGPRLGPLLEAEPTIIGQIGEVPTGIAAGATQAVGTALRGLSAGQPTERFRSYLDQIEHGVQYRGRERAAQVPITDDQAYTDLLGRLADDPGMPETQKLYVRNALEQARKGDLSAVEWARTKLPGAVAERDLWRAGEAVSEWAEEKFPATPGYEHTLGRKVGEGLGSLGAGIATALVPGIGSGVSATFFTAMGMGEAADRAAAAGASDEQIIEAAGLGGGAGATDILPAEMLLGRIPGANAVAHAVKRFGGKRVFQALGRISNQALVESGQEAGQQTLQNIIAAEVHTPETGLLEGVVENAGIGGIVGGIAGLGREGVIALGRRGSRSGRGDRSKAVNEAIARRQSAYRAVDEAEAIGAEAPEWAIAELAQARADEASPIPTEDIIEGRGAIADAEATEAANKYLEVAGLPQIGQPVRVVMARDMGSDERGLSAEARISMRARQQIRAIEGVVADAWQGDDPGLTIRAPDGSETDLTLAELQQAGATLTGLPMPAPREEINRKAEEIAQDAQRLADDAAKAEERAGAVGETQDANARMLAEIEQRLAQLEALQRGEPEPQIDPMFGAEPLPQLDAAQAAEVARLTRAGVPPGEAVRQVTLEPGGVPPGGPALTREPGGVPPGGAPLDISPGGVPAGGSAQDLSPGGVPAGDPALREPMGPGRRPTVVGPAGRPTEAGPQARPEVVGPAGRPDTAGPEARPEVVGPAGRSEDAGPTDRPLVVGPQGRVETGGPDSRPVVIGPAGRPDDTGPGARPIVVGPSGFVETSDGPDARPLVIGPDGRPTEGGPESRPVVVGPAGRVRTSGPDSRPIVVGPDGFAEAQGPEARPQVTGPQGRRAERGPPRRSVVVGPQGRVETSGPDRRPLVIGPDGFVSTQEGPDTRPLIVGPQGRLETGGPDSRPVVIGPAGRLQEMGPDTRPVVVGPSGRLETVGPDSRPVVVGPQGRIEGVGPETRPEVVGPAGRPEADTGPTTRPRAGERERWMQQAIADATGKDMDQARSIAQWVTSLTGDNMNARRALAQAVEEASGTEITQRRALAQAIAGATGKDIDQARGLAQAVATATGRDVNARRALAEAIATSAGRDIDQRRAEALAADDRRQTLDFAALERTPTIEELTQAAIDSGIPPMTSAQMAEQVFDAVKPMPGVEDVAPTPDMVRRAARATGMPDDFAERIARRVAERQERRDIPEREMPERAPAAAAIGERAAPERAPRAGAIPEREAPARAERRDIPETAAPERAAPAEPLQDVVLPERADSAAIPDIAAPERAPRPDAAAEPTQPERAPARDIPEGMADRIAERVAAAPEARALPEGFAQRIAERVAAIPDIQTIDTTDLAERIANRPELRDIPEAQRNRVAARVAVEAKQLPEGFGQIPERAAPRDLPADFGARIAERMAAAPELRTIPPASREAVAREIRDLPADFGQMPERAEGRDIPEGMAARIADRVASIPEIRDIPETQRTRVIERVRQEVEEQIEPPDVALGAPLTRAGVPPGEETVALPSSLPGVERAEGEEAVPRPSAPPPPLMRANGLPYATAKSAALAARARGLPTAKPVKVEGGYALQEPEGPAPGAPQMPEPPSPVETEVREVEAALLQREQDEAVTVYHGQRGDDALRLEDRGDDTILWGTTDKATAERYARFRPDKVTPLSMRLRNPLVVDAQGGRYDEITDVPGMAPGTRYAAEEVAQHAREQGHDGLVIENVRITPGGDGPPTTAYAAFRDAAVAREEDVKLRREERRYAERRGVRGPSVEVGEAQGDQPGLDRAGDLPRVRIRVARQFDEQRARVRSDLDRIGKETFGSQFSVELAESITAPEGDAAPGAYDPQARIAYVAMRADQEGMTATLMHEGVHHLRQAGAFNDARGRPNAAWRTLEDEARRVWREQYQIDQRYGDTPGLTLEQREDLIIEESIAEAVADYATRGKATGFKATTRMALDRIMRFFRAVSQGLKGRGFRSAEAIMEGDILTGAAGRRADEARKASPDQMDRYMQTAWHGAPPPVAGAQPQQPVTEDTIQLQRDAQTPAFKRWFGQSKAVDEAGQPQVVYHGGQFDERQGAAPSIPYAGMFFTSDRDVAESYQNAKGYGGQVTEAHLSLQNPFDQQNPDHVYAPWVKEWIDSWREDDGWVDRFTGEEMSNSEVHGLIESGELPAYRDTYDNDRWHDFLATARDHHDGYIGHDPTDHVGDFAPEIFVAFDPKQIKSVNNKGTFDTESDNILLQRGPETPQANRQEFDQKAKDWSGVDLTGAADAVIKDKDAMGGLVNDLKAQIKAEVKGAKTLTEGAKVTVETGSRPKPQDLGVIQRFAFTPLHWSRKYPEIHKLVRKGVQTEKDMSNRIQRLNKGWDQITRKLSKQEFAELTGLMFLGDAEAHTFTAEELNQFPINDRVKKAYRESRSFIDKMGRFTEQHNRKMSLNMLTQRTELVRKMAGARGMDKGAFRTLYDARAKLLAQQRKGEGDPETVGQQIEDATTALYGQPEAPNEQFEKWLQDADRTQRRIDDTKIRHREGYVPHKFFGKWRIYKKVAPEDAVVRKGFNDQPFQNRKSAERAAEAAGGGTVVETEGGWGYTSQWAHVAGEHGFWQTQQQAVRAAAQMSKKDPNLEMRVAPVEFVFPEDEATQISDAAYHRFTKNAGDMLSLQGEDLQDAVRGVARKRFRRRIAGFSQYRKGVQGYSQDLDRVIRTHIGETVRYVSLDELKYDAINLIEKEGLSEQRSSIQDRPVLSAAVNQWFRDVNGQKQVLESQIDNLLNKPWITPIRGGLAAGAAAFLMTGGPFTAPISPILGAYVGYRVGRGLAQGGPFPTRAITGAMLGDMAHLKLGAFFNLMSALVNTSQIPLNTLPVLGARDTTEGFIRYNKAILSKLRGRPNADWRLMERFDIKPLDTMAEGTRHQFRKESQLSKMSMVFFSTAEGLNRGVTMLGAVNKAQRKGWSVAEARRYANETLDRTQFHYGTSDKPELLRNQILRVPLQFKNYAAHQIAFMLGLKRKELPMFLTSLALMTGTLGMPGLDIIDELTDWLFGFSPVVEMQRVALNAAAEGELYGDAMQMATRGLPALLGIDLQGRIGMGGMLPMQARDLKGPWFDTISKVARFGEEEAKWEHYFKALSPGLGNPLVVLDAWQNGGVMTSAYKRGRPEYTATDEELLIKLIGGAPTRESELRAIREVERHERLEGTKDKRRYVDRIVRALRRGDRPTARRIMEDAQGEGVRITGAMIRNAMQAMATGRAQRELEQLPRGMRQRGAAWREAVGAE